MATSRSIGSDLELLEHLGRPFVELGEIGVLQRVLELRARQPAADVDVLRGLQEEARALDLLELRPQPARSPALRRRRARLLGFSVMKKRPLLSVGVEPPAPIAMA